MPEMPDVATLTTISSNWGNQIRDRTIQRYSSVANRTSEHGSPTEGDLSYLEDANALDVYTGAAWVPVFLTNEVDGSVEVPGSVIITDTPVNVATVNLAIPAGWGSWKCEAYATYYYGAGGNSAAFRIVIDGTGQQVQGPLGTTGSSVVGGRRTGITTTGSRAISLNVDGIGPSGGTVFTTYLYARAVRTS